MEQGGNPEFVCREMGLPVKSGFSFPRTGEF